VSNYPDDIHNYDNDPRSPFFVDPNYVCDGCNQAFEECDMGNERYCWECMRNES
jgi:hypothetical protein